MASLPLTQPLTITTTTSSTATSLCPFPRTKSTLNTRRRHGHVRRSISCNASNQSSDERPFGKVDRRDVLIGLGIAGIGSNPIALADPIGDPDLSTCKNPTTNTGTVLDDKCCLRSDLQIVDFKPPPAKTRIRPAAHKADQAYIDKYNKALSIMRSLPDDDPRSFKQQADIHCIYCSGAYNQGSFPDVSLQVHNSWFFFPFHRWYLYFYERILGSLINDPDFAIPFWNWDHPDGMTMPTMFTKDPKAAVYDANRSPAHQPPFMLDLDFDISKDTGKPSKPYKEQVEENLGIMYKQMVYTATTRDTFFGTAKRAGPVPAGGEAPSAGSIERTPHTPIHLWSGHEGMSPRLDMGDFHSAGRDPMFYAHHGNVDRMWSIWKRLPGRIKKSDIDDPDYLNTTFLFYDENKRLVRVRVGDCLDTRNLGYVYEDMDLPWLHCKPKPKKFVGKGGPRGPHGPHRGHHGPRGRGPRRFGMSGVGAGAAMAAESDDGLTPLTDFPIALESTITVLVPRPNKGRSKAEKEDKEEVLVIEGIEHEVNQAVKFDVFVNDEDEAGPDNTEFAGSYVTVPHGANKNEVIKTSMKIGITELLEDVGADDDESVLVTLVPKTGDVKVSGVKIVLES